MPMTDKPPFGAEAMFNRIDAAGDGGVWYRWLRKDEKKEVDALLRQGRVEFDNAGRVFARVLPPPRPEPAEQYVQGSFPIAIRIVKRWRNLVFAANDSGMTRALYDIDLGGER